MIGDLRIESNPTTAPLFLRTHLTFCEPFGILTNGVALLANLRLMSPGFCHPYQPGIHFLVLGFTLPLFPQFGSFSCLSVQSAK